MAPDGSRASARPGSHPHIGICPSRTFGATVGGVIAADGTVVMLMRIPPQLIALDPDLAIEEVRECEAVYLSRGVEGTVTVRPSAEPDTYRTYVGRVVTIYPELHAVDVHLLPREPVYLG